MSEQNPIKKADLARHWGVARAYLTRLGKPVSEGGKGMPEFTSYAEADAWRALNAPPRPGNALRRRASFAGEHSSPEKPTEEGKNGARNPATTTPPHSNGAARLVTDAWDVGPIDVNAFVQSGVDFDELMPRNAERVAQIAYGLFEKAAATGQPSLVSFATKNFYEAGRVAADVRSRYLELQERTRVLLPLDEVMDILGTELQAVRTALAKHGERCAAAANPADPALAQRVIDADIDQVFATLELLASRARRELAAPAA